MQTRAPLWSQYGAWGGMALFSFFQFFMQIAGNIMAPGWTHSFHLDSTQLGFVSSAFFYGYVLVQLPAGFLFDRWGLKRVARLALGLFTFGLGVFAISPSYHWALAARTLTGIGAGFAFVGMVYAAALTFRPRFFVFFVGLGEMISMCLTSACQLFLPTLILHIGWRGIITGFFLLALTLWLSFFRLPIPERLPHPKESFLVPLQAVFQLKRVWLAGLFCAGLFSVMTVFASLWGNDFLQLRYHYSYLTASHLIAWIPLGFALGSPLLGYLNERLFPHRPLACIVAFLLLLFTLTMMYAAPSPHALAFFLFTMGLLGSGNVLAFYIAERAAPLPYRGMALGLCNALAIGAGMIAQPLMGFLIQFTSLPHAMLFFPFLISLSCCTTLLLFFLPDPPKPHSFSF